MPRKSANYDRLEAMWAAGQPTVLDGATGSELQAMGYPRESDGERPLNFTFYEDSLRYDAFNAVVQQPMLIFQGLRDASVDHRTVEQFARSRPNVILSLLDDDHQLIASLPRMWNDIQPFLGIGE